MKIYKSGQIAEKKTMENFGVVLCSSPVRIRIRNKATQNEFNECYENLLKDMIEKATSKGANAIINFECTTGSYGANGRAYDLIFTGDAVKLDM